VRKSRLTEAGTPRALLQAIGDELPLLGERLAWLSETAEIDAIAAVPYGWRTGATTAGVFRLGDQAGVIPSLAGEGMGIALTSGTLAATAISAGWTAERYQGDLHSRTRRPIIVARTILAAAERPACAQLLVGFGRLAPGLATLLAQVTRVTH